eukprot:6480128-Amphidinium_carterae.2
MPENSCVRVDVMTEILASTTCQCLRQFCPDTSWSNCCPAVSRTMTHGSCIAAHDPVTSLKNLALFDRDAKVEQILAVLQTEGTPENLKSWSDAGAVFLTGTALHVLEVAHARLGQSDKHRVSWHVFGVPVWKDLLVIPKDFIIAELVKKDVSGIKILF